MLCFQFSISGYDSKKKRKKIKKSLVDRKTLAMQTFEFRANAERTGLIDSDAGKIFDVSVISTPEAKGHGIKIDQASIESFYNATKGKQIKAFYTHEENEALDAIGFWENFKIIEDEQYIKLQADFVALDAWKKHHTDLYDSLFEMAEKAPESFGVSAEFTGKAIYYSEDGEEIEYKHGDDEEKEIYARATEVTAFSIVAQPAANPTGLFAEAKEIEPDEIDTEEFLSFNLNQTIAELHEVKQELELANKTSDILEAGLDEKNEVIAELEKKLELNKQQAESWQKKFNDLLSGAEPVQVNEPISEKKSFEEQLAAASTWSEKNKLFKENMFNLLSDWNK